MKPQAVLAAIVTLVETTPDFDDPNIPDQADQSWHQSADAASLFPGSTRQAYSHLAFSVSLDSTEWPAPEGSVRRRPGGGDVSTTVTLRWLYGTQIDQTADSYVSMLTAEQEMLATIMGTQRQTGPLRITVEGVTRTALTDTEPSVVRTAWFLGTVTLRADHIYDA